MSYVHAAMKALIQDGDKYLVIQQEFNGLKRWDLPGGRVDHGESPYDTLHREVKEEVGLDISVIKPIGVWWFFRDSDKDQVVCTTFLCKPKHKDVNITNNPANENIVKYAWLTKKEFLTDDYPVSNKSLKDLVSNL